MLAALFLRFSFREARRSAALPPPFPLPPHAASPIASIFNPPVTSTLRRCVAFSIAFDSFASFSLPEVVCLSLLLFLIVVVLLLLLLLLRPVWAVLMRTDLVLPVLLSLTLPSAATDLPPPFLLVALLLFSLGRNPFAPPAFAEPALPMPPRLLTPPLPLPVPAVAAPGGLAPCRLVHSCSKCSGMSNARSLTPHPSVHSIHRIRQCRVACTPAWMAGIRSPQDCLHGTSRNRHVNRSWWSRSWIANSFRQPCTRHCTGRQGHSSRSCWAKTFAFTSWVHRLHLLLRSGHSYLRCKCITFAGTRVITLSVMGTFSSSTQPYSHIAKRSEHWVC
mmetsp:Transcript_31857/g.53240  ORF Transcript_31857/g.53240 Transcript_31857/m.53240 type:complete len:333 (+) Transcript_31857:270-1268(+)